MDKEHHKIRGKLEGDIVIYRCEQCDYWATKNLSTGEFKVHNLKLHIRHSGWIGPPTVRFDIDTSLASRTVH